MNDALKSPDSCAARTLLAILEKDRGDTDLLKLAWADSGADRAGMVLAYRTAVIAVEMLRGSGYTDDELRDALLARLRSRALATA